MTDRERELLMVLKDLLEICRYKCSPRDEIVRADGLSNEQIMIGATNLVARYEAEESPPPSAHLTRFNTGMAPGTRSNAEIRRRNGGVKHQFEDDIGGCSANYR